jgi:type IV secretory pathway VirB10-like protein
MGDAVMAQLDNALDTLATRMAAAGRAPLGYRNNGRAIWPIFGAEDNPPAPTAPPAPPPAPPADPGFPVGTAVADMTAEQQAAYWKHQSRKHEDRAKVFGDLTADQLKSLRDKAKRQDELELELGTTADKAAAKARDEAAAAARAELLPQLVTAKLEAATAGRVTSDAIAKALEFVDTAKFLTDGKVDTAKVKSFADSLAPATGTQPPSPRPGPTPSGQGHRTPATASPGDPARAWLARQGIKVD